MYHGKLWDEDKWNIHSGSYNSSKYSNSSGNEKKEDKKYHEQKYGSGDKANSSDYIKKEEQKEKDEKKEDPLFADLEEGKKVQELKEEEIPFKAAQQVFSESASMPRKSDRKKEMSSIEEAIKNAVEEEKKVVIMDS